MAPTHSISLSCSFLFFFDDVEPHHSRAFRTYLCNVNPNFTTPTTKNRVSGNQLNFLCIIKSTYSSPQTRPLTNKVYPDSPSSFSLLSLSLSLLSFSPPILLFWRINLQQSLLYLFQALLHGLSHLRLHPPQKHKSLCAAHAPHHCSWVIGTASLSLYQWTTPPIPSLLFSFFLSF